MSLPSMFSEDQAEMVDLFRRSPRARLCMRAALRAEDGRYTKVRDEWSDEDLTAFAAWEMYEAEGQLDRCPGCGCEPGDMVDLESGRRLASPRFKFVHLVCDTCRTLAKFNEEAEPGERVVLRPRLPGEPVEEERLV